MKRLIVILCALYLVLAYGTAFAAPPSKKTPPFIPPAWSQTLQCDTTACPRFELVMGGAGVLDKETGLVWEQAPSTTAHIWQYAIYSCLDKVAGNRKGWRLPTVEQLASLVDPSMSVPSLPSGHPFTNVQQVYWSASTNVGITAYAFHVEFGSGVVGNEGKDGYHYAWCVRGGQGYDGQ